MAAIATEASVTVGTRTLLCCVDVQGSPSPLILISHVIYMTSWTVEFVRAALTDMSDWPDELRASLIRIVDRIEALGLDRVGEPLVKHIEGKIWEMRASGRDREGRALYASIRDRRVIVLLSFIKKTGKTPRRMVELAKQRLEQVK